MSVLNLQNIFDGITTAWSDKHQPIQHRLQVKKAEKLKMMNDE